MEPTPECFCSAKLTLKTDKYPGDTGWTLSEKSQNGSVTVIDSRGKKSGYQKNTKYETEWRCLNNSEYVFLIEDHWKDGLSCFKKSKGSVEKSCGWYSLEVDGNIIHQSGPGPSGDFGAQEEVTFSCKD